MSRITNAKIRSISLGRGEHGILTFYIWFGASDGLYRVGGYALEEYSKDDEHPTCLAMGLEAIARILDTVGVGDWEQLKGEYARIEIVDDPRGDVVLAIGNIIKDDWFRIDEHFNRKAETGV